MLYVCIIFLKVMVVVSISLENLNLLSAKMFQIGISSEYLDFLCVNLD